MTGDQQSQLFQHEHGTAKGHKPTVAKQTESPTVARLADTASCGGPLLGHATKLQTVLRSTLFPFAHDIVSSGGRDRLSGLVVKVSVSRTECPGFESRLRRDISGPSHTSSLGGRNSAVGSAWARCPQRRGFDPPLGTFSGRGDFSLGVNMGSNSIPQKLFRMRV